MLVSRRAGTLTAFGNAVLLGLGGPDEAIEAVTGADALHRVVGLPGEPGPVSLALALGVLRGLGVQGLRLVLPEPGDVVGMPGSGDGVRRGRALRQRRPHRGSAVGPGARPAAHGGAVRPRRRRPLGRRATVEFALAPHGLPTLSEAERSLAESMRETTAALDVLDVAKGRGDVAGSLARLEREVRTLPLPASMVPRAQRTVVAASRLLGILTVAADSESAAVTAARRSAAPPARCGSWPATRSARRTRWRRSRPTTAVRTLARVDAT